MLEIHPDVAIPFPESGAKFTDFREKVAAACRTIELLGIDTSNPTESDEDAAEKALYELAEATTDQSLAINTTKTFRPATYGVVEGLLKEYSVRVVENATQIRLLVTNKLLLETENPDPRIRMRALELLGKVTDVGLFTEKSEVTVTHRSTEDLVTNIRNKIAAMREPKDINTASEPVVIDGTAIDISAELGL